MLLENYFNTLGISFDASIDEIHHAYRQRAKELHPDINHSPLAHRDFLYLHEAYEYIISNYQDIKLTYDHIHHKCYHKGNNNDLENYGTYFCRERKKFTDVKGGSHLFIIFHIVFIILGIAMVSIPVISVLFFSSYINLSVVITLISFTGAVGLGFSMIWKLGHSLRRFLLYKKV